MDEFYTNNYVIDIKTEHPGNTTYTIYSTREHMTLLVEELSRKLKDTPAPQVTWPPPGQLLWKQYMTIAKGTTSRQFLAFSIVDDLAPFHIRPTFKSRACDWLRIAFILSVVIFAFIGVDATMTGKVHIAPFILGILYFVPLACIAVFILLLRDAISRQRI